MSALPSFNRPTPTAEALYQLDRVRAYASDEFGAIGNGSTVFSYDPNFGGSPNGSCLKIVEGKMPNPGQRVVYVDGGFDLFSSGHIEFLKLVVQTEVKGAAERGEYEVDGDSSSGGRKPYVIAGVHDDKTINKFKGLNYPIMNLFERALCVLQCRVSTVFVCSYPFFFSLTYSSTYLRLYYPLHSSLPLHFSVSSPLVGSLTLFITAQPSSCLLKQTPMWTSSKLGMSLGNLFLDKFRSMNGVELTLEKLWGELFDRGFYMRKGRGGSKPKRTKKQL